MARRVASFLTLEEVGQVHEFAKSVTAPEAKHDLSEDRSRDVIYCSYEDAFRTRLPGIYERCRSSAQRFHVSRGGSETEPFNLRVAEYHTDHPGGGIFDPSHVDAGSLVTVDVMLTNTFEGGCFCTSERDGPVHRHPEFKGIGDTVFFPSTQRHHVERVTTGPRQVLVLEFWSGEPRVCAHRCPQRHGPCREIIHDPIGRQKSFFDSTFFDSIDEDVLREACLALDDDVSTDDVSTEPHAANIALAVA